MSIARPYACCDHDVLCSTRRQLNADVLSAAIERSSSAPYRSTSTIRRIGKRALYSVRIAATTGRTASRLRTSRPVCGRSSNPQYANRTSLNSEIGTGQPRCHETMCVGAGATVA